MGAILDAAEDVLVAKPDASIGEIAAAAGVARQTIYGHFRTRDALLTGMLERARQQTLLAFDLAGPESGPADEALDRLVGAWWTTVRRHARVLGALAPSLPNADAHAFHAPIVERLEKLAKRGRRQGVFAKDTPVAWQAAAFLGLVHAAAEEVAAGRLTEDAAGAALATTVPRVFGVTG